MEKPAIIDYTDDVEAIRDKLVLILDDIYRKFESLDMNVYDFVAEDPIPQQVISSIQTDEVVEDPGAESVEDIVGAMVSGNTETLIAVTYQDGDGTLDFVVDEASVDHDALTNFVAGEHFTVEDENNILANQVFS